MSDMKGFTLIEVLMVVAISIMLATIAVSYTTATRNVGIMSTEAAQAAGFIFRARELALSTYAEPSSGSTGLVCGYGVSFSIAADSYSIFAYKPDVNVYGQPNGTIPVSGGILAYCPSTASTTAEGIYESEMAATVAGAWNVVLPPEVRLESGGMNDDLAVILFIPPNPDVLLGKAPLGNPAAFLPQGALTSTLRVYIAAADGSATTSVAVNGNGGVSY